MHNETELHCEMCKQWGDSDEDGSNDSKGIAIVDDIGGRRFPTTTNAEEKNVKIPNYLFTSQLFSPKHYQFQNT
jgi:hypothetical protein